MSANPHQVPSFDIFSGESVHDAMWVEAVEGLAAAIERMDTIALKEPGAYFVYNAKSAQILARANTKYRRSRSASGAA